MSSAQGGLSVSGTSMRTKSLKQVATMPRITAQQALDLLETKLGEKYNSVKKAFITMDYDLDGKLSKDEMRVSFDLMGLVLSEADYEKVWKTFNTKDENFISYTEFNNKLGPMIHPTISKPLISRPRTPRVRAATAKTMAKSLKKKLSSLDEAFGMIDSDGSGRISHAEFIQAMRYAGMKNMDHDSSYELMTKYKPASDTQPGIDKATFITTMEQYLELPAVEQEARKMKSFDAHPATSLSHAERLLSEKLWGKYTAVQKAFRKFDSDKSGALSPAEFREAIGHLGVHLTDPDFRDLVAQYDENGDGSISYDEFNKRVGPLLHPEAMGQRLAATSRKEAVSGEHTLQPSSLELAQHDMPERARMAGARLGISPAEAHMVIRLYGKYDELQHAMRAADVSNQGGVTEDELCDVLASLGVDLSESNLRMLSQKYDANGDGLVSYDEINARLASLIVPSADNDTLLGIQSSQQPVPANPSTRRGAASGHAGKVASSARSSFAGSRAGSLQSGMDWDAVSVGGSSVSTSAIDLQATESKMRKILGRSWTSVYKDMQRKHAAGAEAGRGISATGFQDAMAKQGVPLTSKEVRALARKYNSRPGTGASVDYKTMMRGTFGAHK